MTAGDPGGRAKVLLVEDDPTCRDFVKATLKKASDRYYFIEPVSSLAEGLRMLRERVFDVLLLDLMLPDSKGPDTVTEIRKLNTQIPIIIVTGMEDDTILFSAMEEGAQDYLIKGHFNADLLSKSIEYAIHTKKSEEQAECLKEQLMHAQKMEVVGRLAGGVAHDFNNLLTVINGYADILKSKIPETEEIYVHVNEIARAGKKAASIAKQLLAFSRRRPAETKVVNLNNMLNEMIRMVRRLIGEDVELTFEPGEDVPAVKADPGSMEQVVVNLVINARDAMPGGGSITIRTAATKLDAEMTTRFENIPAGDYTVLSVKDTGCGMSEDVKQHLFEPFFSTKGPDKGTGIGLATALGIIKQSNGYITVDSKEGAGACFSIYMPACAEKANKADKDPTYSPERGGGETVLVVEDDANVRRYVKEVLARCGYKILTAGNGDDAIEVVRREEGGVDLLLTDLIMPKMAGDTLVELLKEARPGIKVVFMTGYLEAGLSNGARIELADGILEKPISPAALAAEIRRVLDEKAKGS